MHTAEKGYSPNAPEVSSNILL